MTGSVAPESSTGEACVEPATEAVRLAEFHSLRQEITDRSSRQQALLALNVAAVGAVVGFVVGEQAPPELLLVIAITLRCWACSGSIMTRTSNGSGDTSLTTFGSGNHRGSGRSNRTTDPGRLSSGPLFCWSSAARPSHRSRWLGRGSTGRRVSGRCGSRGRPSASSTSARTYYASRWYGDARRPLDGSLLRERDAGNG